MSKDYRNRYSTPVNSALSLMQPPDPQAAWISPEPTALIQKRWPLYPWRTMKNSGHGLASIANARIDVLAGIQQQSHATLGSDCLTMFTLMKPLLATLSAPVEFAENTKGVRRKAIGRMWWCCSEISKLRQRRLPHSICGGRPTGGDCGKRRDGASANTGAGDDKLWRWTRFPVFEMSSHAAGATWLWQDNKFRMIALDYQG
jgi:hypothetical protein